MGYETSDAVMRYAEIEHSYRYWCYALTLFCRMLILGLVVFPVSLHADQFLVFGPEAIIHSRDMREHNLEFSVATPNAQYLLVIETGTSDTSLIRKGTITLNGVEVLDLHKVESYYETPVSLLANNLLHIEFKGKPEGEIMVSVWRTDNTPPVANAGPDQSVLVSDSVMLDGSRSSDSDGDPLSFNWQLFAPLNSAATLTDTNAVKPSFTADVAGTYEAELIVSDGIEDSAPDNVIITTENSAPVANAGPDQTAFVTDTVTLDGSNSSDVDGDALTLSWSLVSVPDGSTANLSDNGAVNPSFFVDLPGTYIAELVVNDGLVDSAADTVTITTENSPPVANAGPDQTVFVTDTVWLDGNGSTDVDGDALTYRWSLTSKPQNSQSTLSEPGAITPSFVVDAPGIYTAQLIVNDGSVDSAPDTVTVTTENSPPVANAGPDQTLFVGGTALLDGSGSSDVDGDLLSFSWSLTSMPTDSTATLDDPTLVTPSFEIDQPGTYVVQLIVNDGTENSEPVSITITTLNSKPVADAGPDQFVFVDDTAILDGSVSQDVDGDPLSYFWSLLSIPQGSLANLSDPAAVNPSFDVDQPGTYVAQLIVNDGAQDSEPDTVMLETLNRPPQASIDNPGPVQSLDLSIVLDGSGSSDPDGDPLVYSWSLVSAPAGNTALITDPVAEVTDFTPNAVGSYTVELEVSDGLEQSITSISFNVIANAKPVAHAGPDRTIVLGDAAMLDGSGSSDPNGDPLTFAWSIITRPSGSAAQPEAPSDAVTSLMPDAVGNYTVQLQVSDGLDLSEPDTALVVVSAPPPLDSDGDGLSDEAERALGTDPNLPDSDGDGIDDLAELERGSNPTLSDSDNDGLSDADELDIYGTDPLNPDSDGDGFNDQEEVLAGSDPNSAASVPPKPGANLTKITSSPANGEGDVAITRETVIYFSRPLADSTVIDDSKLFAEFGGARLPARIQLNSTRTKATLFYASPLPASARIRVTLLSNSILDINNDAVDVDNDGIPGGTVFIDFDTLGLTSVEGTAICGRVFASELIPGENGASLNEPLAGVTITVDGATHISAITDQFGNFRLENAPAGRFFVHIDGRTSDKPLPAGAYYPFVGKAWESVAGEEVTIGTVHLPLIQQGSLQPVSETEDTVITFPDAVLADYPELDGVSLTVPAGSLYADDGTSGGMVGIAPVDPNRLPGTLPPELQFPLVITVQTDGATNFDQPVPICFPNLPNPETGEILQPGEKTALWSFNHDTGRFEIAGSMTVTTDGSLVCSDPGVGILAPGWHGVNLGTPVNGGQILDDSATATDSPQLEAANQEGPIPEAANNAIDPVYLFSGEFHEEVVDLRIKGRGLDFVWSRKYRSKIAFQTELGHQWDYAYNIRIAPQGDDVLLFNGNTRQDLYTLQPDGSWTRNEFFRRLIQNTDESYTLSFEDTARWHFLPLNGTAAEGKIDIIEDRNGNRISFAYDTLGRLQTITDSLDRDIQLAYNAAGLIESLTDFTGRVVRYDYYDGTEPGGSAGDLKSATSPAVTGTPTGNDFPGGKTSSYTYSRGFADERLNHNLLSITDGRRNDPADPTFGEGPYLVNNYAATSDPSSLNYDRVIRQLWGGNRLDVVYVSQNPTTTNGQAILKTIVNDRVGNVTEFFWDNRNRGVMMREYTGRANPAQPTTELSNRPTGKLRSGDPDFFETRTAFNQDSLPTRVTHPNGNITEYVYESELNPGADPRSRGNLRILRQRPGSHQPAGDQSLIQELFEYDPTFNFVSRHTDGRGAATRHSYDGNGNRIQTSHRIASIVEDFEYNAFGQLRAHLLPDNGSGHRRRDEYSYYVSGAQLGYLQQQVVDAGNFNLTTGYEYDLVGNRIRMTDPRGQDTQYVVNQLNQVVREISREVGNGQTVRYQRDTHYDANNNVIRRDIQNIDETGNLQANSQFSNSYEYEILDYLVRATQEVDASHSIVTEHEYDANRNRTLELNGEAVNGNQPANRVQTLYDERDLPFLVVQAPGTGDQSSTQLDYDRNGNLVKKTSGLEDAAPRIQLYQYDAYNRQISATDPMGNRRLYSYDANSNSVAEIMQGELEDVNGSTNNSRLSEVGFVYDALDRQVLRSEAFFDTETQAPIGDGTATTQSFYSDNSQVLRMVDDNDHQTTIHYDSANRRSQLIDAKGNSVIYDYDANSNLINRTEVEVSDLGNPDQSFVTQYSYDNLDRLVRTVDNVGNTNDFGYDSRNNRTLHSDALRTGSNEPGNIVRYRYDGLNRLIATERLLTDTGDGSGTVVDSITTTQEWDDNSRLIAQTDDNGNRTAYGYDALNRRISLSYADGTENAYLYDVHHNVVEMLDANGNQVLNQYDLLDRLSARSIVTGPGVVPDTTFENYQYDGLSRYAFGEDNDSFVGRRYDSLSNIVEENQNGQIISSLYDGVDNQLQCTYPGGRVVDVSYDSLDRKQQIGDQDGMIAEYDYIGPQRTEQRRYRNGTTSDWGYDGIKRIIETQHSRDIGLATEVFDRRSYSWDPMFNKTRRQDLTSGGLTHDYGYDSVYRMIRSERSDGSTSSVIDYSFDGVGNRTSVTGGDQPGPYTLDATTPEPADLQVNQYSTTSFDARLYDRNGNLTTIDNGLSGQRDLGYDYRNQMVSHTDQATGVVISTYAYDVLGRRIGKTVDDGTPETTLYFYDGWQVLEEQDGLNNTQATYIYGPYIDEVLNMQHGSESYFYHTDEMYNVMKVTDNFGGVIEKYRYGDYAEPEIFDASDNKILTSSIHNSYLFSGRRSDFETNLYQYRTRYYDYKAGRFTSKDISGEWYDLRNKGNGYIYGNNNLFSLLDPFGLKSKNGPMDDQQSNSNNSSAESKKETIERILIYLAENQKNDIKKLNKAIDEYKKVEKDIESLQPQYDKDKEWINKIGKLDKHSKKTLEDLRDKAISEYIKGISKKSAPELMSTALNEAIEFGTTREMEKGIRIILDTIHNQSPKSEIDKLSYENSARAQAINILNERILNRDKELGKFMNNYLAP